MWRVCARRTALAPGERERVISVIRVIRVISPPTRPLAIFFRMEKSGQNARESWASICGSRSKRALMGSAGTAGEDYFTVPLGAVMIFEEYKEFRKF